MTGEGRSLFALKCIHNNTPISHGSLLHFLFLQVLRIHTESSDSPWIPVHRFFFSDYNNKVASWMRYSDRWCSNLFIEERSMYCMIYILSIKFKFLWSVTFLLKTYVPDSYVTTPHPNYSDLLIPPRKQQQSVVDRSILPSLDLIGCCVISIFWIFTIMILLFTHNIKNKKDYIGWIY